jgi:hypothetical protein
MPDPVREEMLRRGICFWCAAYRGRDGKNKSCHAMQTPGCPVPEESRIYMEKFNESQGKAK